MSIETVAGKSASHVNIALWLYALLVIVVTAVSWAVYWCDGNIQDRPLFEKSDQFHDLTNYIDKTAHLLHGAAALGRGLPIYTYPAPAAFVYKILIYTFPGHAVRTYLGFFVICILGFAIVTWRACRPSRAVRLSAAAAIATTAALSYPIWFTADRGNIECVVWALSTAGLCFLLRGKYRTAAVLIGLTACIKPFTIIFLLLLLRRRRYKTAARGVATAGLVFLAALTALGPNPWKTYQELKPGQTLYISRYITTLAPFDEERFAHSLLDGLKSAALILKMRGFHPQYALRVVEDLRARSGGWFAVRWIVDAYPFVVIAGLGLLFAAFYKMPVLNQVIALCAAVTLFPPASSDYTLLSLYLSFGAFVVFLTREVATGKAALSYASMLALAVIYALLFSPLTFLMIYAGDTKLLLLLALLVVVARSPMPSAYFGDPADDRLTLEHTITPPSQV